MTLTENVAVATPDQIGEDPLRALLQRAAWHKQNREIETASNAVLSDLGIAFLSEKCGNELSLGQAKRVGIARAIQSGARILFLDEPLAGLDAKGIEEVLSLLGSLAASRKVTIVIVEHIFNISRVLQIATKVWTLRKGKVVTQTPQEIRDEESCDRDLQQVIERFAGSGGLITRAPLTNGASLCTVARNGTANNETVLELENVVVYRGKRLVIGERMEDGSIQGLSLKLRRGQIAILHAPNGWGKTSLFEAIAGMLPITSGRILVADESVCSMPAWKRVGLGLSLLRARNNIFSNLTVKESLRVCKGNVPKSLEKFLRKRISDLSGGERQRVLVNSVLGDPSLTVGLLDEPFSALDPERVEELTGSIIEKSTAAAMLIAIPSTSRS